jgi:protein phosphatase
MHSNGAGRSGGNFDPEELRYAPRAPRRFLWLRRLTVLVLVLGLIGGGGWFAYRWTQTQYYVGTDGDYVVIFKGVDEQIPGLTLSSTFEKQTLQVDKLPTYNRQQVEGTIQADNLAAARTIVSELQRTADDCAAQKAPKPTPTPKPRPSTPPASGKPASTPPKPPASKATVSLPTASASTPGGTNPDECDGAR